MKILDRIGLILFSAIILVLAILVSVMYFGWIEFPYMLNGIQSIIEGEISGNVAFGISVILILLSIKCIFFNGYSREKLKSKEGIILENDNGKLIVSRDTIENLASAVVKTYESAENVVTKVEVDKETNIKVLITLQVYQDAVIKDLTNKLQTDIKSAIKKSLNLEVKEIVVRIKDIAVKKEPVIKE